MRTDQHTCGNATVDFEATATRYKCTGYLNDTKEQRGRTEESLSRWGDTNG